MTGLTNYVPDIVWNFYEATSITLAGDFEGAILAPYANVINSTGVLTGQVFVNSWNSVMEIHYVKFTGCLPYLSAVRGAPTSCY